MFYRRQWLSALLASSLPTHVLAVGGLSSCPTAATNIATTSGRIFQFCKGTDFQGPSIQITTVTSSQDCVNLCGKTSGCTRAVFDEITLACHIKGDGASLQWAVNTRFDTITYSNTVTDGSAITACPSSETTISNADGSKSIICPLADYQAPSVEILNSVANVASCAASCRARSGCSKAVFDHVNLICHIKGASSANIAWVVSLKQYDTIRIVSASITTSTSKTATTASIATPSATAIAGLKACPTNQATYTTDDGSLYQICPNADFQGPSIAMLQGSLSTIDCLQTCRSIYNCANAVYDNINLICHIKTDANQLTWSVSTNQQFNTIHFVQKQVAAQPPYAGLGAWGPVIMMPVIPVAAYVVPEQPVSNRLLMFSSWGSYDFSGPTGITQFADYNYKTGQVSQRTITNTNHDMFCPGISSLEDGRIVITGGENAEATSIYDPISNNFVRGPDMKLPRGYQSSCTTSAGKIFTVGGSFNGGIGGKVGEILDPKANTWTLLPGADVTPILTTDAEGAWRTDNHAWLFGWKDGSVFQAGPSKSQHWFNTNNNGSVVAAGIRDPDNDAMCGVNAMYDAVNGKIFSTGGSQDYTNSPALKRAYITSINQPYQPASVERVADMGNPRGFANAVVLPDGTILITGGMRTSYVFSDYDAVLTPELFDPVSKTFKTLAAESIPRNYHAVSLLLADGTVFSGGGGLCPTGYGISDAQCNRAVDHPSAQIFSPPYLFNADGSAATRPVIASMTTSTDSNGLSVRVGGTLTVNMSDASGTTFSLMRMGSVTHSTNSDQRRVPLTNVQVNKAAYTIKLPTDSGVLIPGYYYLFGISKTGVPSIARTVQIKL